MATENGTFSYNPTTSGIYTWSFRMKNSGTLAQPASVCYLDNLQVSYPYPYTRIDCDKGPNASYRFGFNGKENDMETLTQDYGFRIYNPALGRFLSVDPLTKSYPWYTPFQFGGNKPIWAVDLDGLEERCVSENGQKIDYYATYIVEQKVMDNIDIKQLQIDVNNILNSQPVKVEGENCNPVSTQFHIEIIPEQNSEVTNFQTGDITSNYSPDGMQNRGGIIKMGKADDSHFYDKTKNKYINEIAYWKNNNWIILNPRYYDEKSIDYIGFKNSVNTPSTSIIHEIGHDLGLKHGEGENGYPKAGVMSNEGTNIPTECEIESINKNKDQLIIYENK